MNVHAHCTSELEYYRHRDTVPLLAPCFPEGTTTQSLFITPFLFLTNRFSSHVGSLG